MSAASDALKRISALAQLMTIQAADVLRAQEVLVGAMAALSRTEREDLPALMAELELSEIKLIDGSKVTIKNELTCGISEDRRAAAHAWLTAHGFEGLIKTGLTIPFGREEAAAAHLAAAQISAQLGREVLVADAVHPQTLKAFLKEQAEAGKLGEHMRVLFGVHQYSIAKLTRKR